MLYESLADIPACYMCTLQMISFPRIFNISNAWLCLRTNKMLGTYGAYATNLTLALEQVRCSHGKNSAAGALATTNVEEQGDPSPTSQTEPNQNRYQPPLRDTCGIERPTSESMPWRTQMVMAAVGKMVAIYGAFDWVATTAEGGKQSYPPGDALVSAGSAMMLLMVLTMVAIAAQRKRRQCEQQQGDERFG